MSNLEVKHKIWLSSADCKGAYGGGKHRLLKAIEECGSLSEASRQLQISYRKAWGDIKKAETGLGFPLLEKTRGGRRGGRSVLTERAKQLLVAYEVFSNEIDQLLAQKASALLDKLNKHLED